MKTFARKKLFGSIIAATLLVVAPAASATATVEVYKSPTCGCCDKWVDHMRDNGFTVITKDVGNKEMRQKIWHFQLTGFMSHGSGQWLRN